MYIKRNMTDAEGFNLDIRVCPKFCVNTEMRCK